LAKLIDTTKRITQRPTKPASIGVRFHYIRANDGGGRMILQPHDNDSSDDAEEAGVAVDTHVHENRMRTVFELLNLLLGLDVVVAEIVYSDCIEGGAEAALEQLATSDEATRDVRRAALSLWKRVMMATGKSSTVVAAAAASAAASSSASAAVFDGNENTEEEESAAAAAAAADKEDNAASSHKLCSICYDSKLLTEFVIFLPCGHITCCNACSYQVKICTICRAPIADRRKVFV
jgi:hypothetical protein